MGDSDKNEVKKNGKILFNHYFQPNFYVHGQIPPPSCRKVLINTPAKKRHDSFKLGISKILPWFPQIKAWLLQHNKLHHPFWAFRAMCILGPHFGFSFGIFVVGPHGVHTNMPQSWHNVRTLDADPGQLPCGQLQDPTPPGWQTFTRMFGKTGSKNMQLVAKKKIQKKTKI